MLCTVTLLVKTKQEFSLALFCIKQFLHAKRKRRKEKEFPNFPTFSVDPCFSIVFVIRLFLPRQFRYNILLVTKSMRSRCKKCRTLSCRKETSEHDSQSMCHQFQMERSRSRFSIEEWCLADFRSMRRQFKTEGA